MQIVLVLWTHVFRYVLVKVLLLQQYNGCEWNSICAASQEVNLVKMSVDSNSLELEMLVFCFEQHKLNSVPLHCIVWSPQSTLLSCAQDMDLVHTSYKTTRRISIALL